MVPFYTIEKTEYADCSSSLARNCGKAYSSIDVLWICWSAGLSILNESKDRSPHIGPIL